MPESASVLRYMYIVCHVYNSDEACLLCGTTRILLMQFVLILAFTYITFQRLLHLTYRVVTIELLSSLPTESIYVLRTNRTLNTDAFSYKNSAIR
jgi:hypothetical protein